MSAKTQIEWTATVHADGSVTPGATWNPVRGCTKVSPGCAHCYAETFAERFMGVPGHPYEQGFDLRLVPEKLTEPLRWKKPRRVFVNSMSDLFQEGVPDAYIDQVFAVMALASQHTFQVLTKRPERMFAYFERLGLRQELIGIEAERISGCDRYDVSGIGARWKLPLLNVWLGCSVENQHFADERIPLLLQTPAAVRFISAEPLLGPVDLRDHLEGREEHGTPFSDPPARTVGGCIGWTPPLDWVIVGGESGPGARPFEVAWARAILAQCQAAGVPCFIKQLGANAHIPDEWDGKFTTDITLRDKKGGVMAEWPADLRVREFPEGRP